MTGVKNPTAIATPSAVQRSHPVVSVPNSKPNTIYCWHEMVILCMHSDNVCMLWVLHLYYARVIFLNISCVPCPQVQERGCLHKAIRPPPAIHSWQSTTALHWWGFRTAFNMFCTAVVMLFYNLTVKSCIIRFVFLYNMGNLRTLCWQSDHWQLSFPPRQDLTVKEFVIFLYLSFLKTFPVTLFRHTFL